MKKMALVLALVAASIACPAEGILRWGADSEGGAPYIFTDPSDPNRLIGYESDLMDALAAELGMKAQFVQNQWDGLIPGLERGNYDVAINGIEITPDRQQVVNFSDPYYITYEALIVRKETDNIKSLKDCHGKIVGTLKGALSERILRDEPGIDVRTYDGQVNVFEDLANGRLDAALQDHPIALYYALPNPRLKLVETEPIGRMEYGIAVRKSDKKLLKELNKGLQNLAQSGKLRKIYEKWGLWNKPMAEYLKDPVPSLYDAPAYKAYVAAINKSRPWSERFKQYWSYVPLLARGAVMTVALSVVAMALAVAGGLIVALVRIYTPAIFRSLAVGYIELMRGTPLLLQLYFIFYGLPNIGIKLSPFVAAVLGLGLNYAAYEAENYRAGLIAVPRQQMEAALALGMTRLQALRHIILPQAFRVVIPPMTNDFISLLKDSSLVSLITMVELTKMYGMLASTYYDYFGVGIITAIFYLLIGLPFVTLSRWAEKKFAPAEVHRPRLHA